MGDPKAAPFQVSPHQAARLVDFLLYNDVEVEQATGAFAVDGVTYPAGTYVVWMNQPKRGLANVLLDDGLDLSGISGLFFYSPPSTWSNPLAVGHEASGDGGQGRRLRRVRSPRLTRHAARPRAARPPRTPTCPRASRPSRPPTSCSRAASPCRARRFLHRQRPQLRSRRRHPPGDPKTLANELASRYGLDVYALRGVPAGAIALRRQRIAVAFSDAGGGSCSSDLASRTSDHDGTTERRDQAAADGVRRVHQHQRPLQYRGSTPPARPG